MPLLRVLRLRALRALVVSFVFVFFSHATILFHSNFENERTYTAAALKPGATKIKLLPSPEIDQWFPETGGEAIIEPNYPKNREVFQYTRCKGNRLIAVSGIARPHAKHVAIRSGSLAEWYSEPREIKRFTNGKITIDNTHPLAGSHSAVVECNTNAKAALTCASPLMGGNRIHVRFLIRFSSGCFENEIDDFNIFAGIQGRYTPPRLAFRHRKGDPAAALELRNAHPAKILQRISHESVSILPETDYCVEISTTVISKRKTRSNLWLDGRLKSTCILEHQLHEEGKTDVNIGKLHTASLPGRIWLDEIVIADSAIGTVHPKPFPSFSDQVLSCLPPSQTSGLGFTTQWQISSGNSWLLPALNTTKKVESVWKLSIPHPINLSAVNRKFRPGLRQPAMMNLGSGTVALARMRYRSTNELWSEWSAPLAFELPKIPEAPADIQVKDAWLTIPGKSKRIRNIRPGQWVDAHFRFSPVSENSFLDVNLNGDPERSRMDYHNRGGALRAKDNYVLNLSFPDQGVWALKDTTDSEGTCLIGIQGLYCDDRQGISRLDHKAGIARIRFRLLSSAIPGTWRLSAFVLEHNTGVSPIHQSLFFVNDNDGSKDQPQNRTGWLVASLGLLLLIVLALRSYLRNRSKPATQSDQPELETAALSGESTDNKRVKDANDFILANYIRPISLQDVADAVGLSPSWLSKTFKDQTGKNIVPYINELRIQKAKELLQDPKSKIGEVALQVGFNSPGNFNIAFKKVVGESPQSFKNTQNPS